MRVFSGAVLGYLLFAIAYYLLFHVTNTDPHAAASITFELVAVIYGLLFALLAGYIASFIGGRPHFVAAWIVGALIALAEIISMIRFGIGWVQMLALVLMGPAAVLGGWSYVLQQRGRRRVM
jgi:fructose-specific phosphotransferase system IIC component